MNPREWFLYLLSCFVLIACVIVSLLSSFAWQIPIEYFAVSIVFLIQAKLYVMKSAPPDNPLRNRWGKVALGLLPSFLTFSLGIALLIWEDWGRGALPILAGFLFMDTVGILNRKTAVRRPGETPLLHDQGAIQ